LDIKVSVVFKIIEHGYMYYKYIVRFGILATVLLRIQVQGQPVQEDRFKILGNTLGHSITS
jgi:hypothetical protein